MKNKEKHVKEIIELAVKDAPFGFHKDLNKIMPCYGIECQKCLFHGPRVCSIARREWANAEYKEPKLFTDREIEFIKLFPEIKYLAKNYDGKLFAYRQKPFKDEERGWWTCDNDDILFKNLFGDLLKFSAIKWKDEEPTSREEILGESDE